MKEIIAKFLDQFQSALNIKVSSPNFIKAGSVFDKVIFCGMGASASASGIVSDLFLKNICFHFCRDYKLPSFTDENSLIIIVSYSGNTDEAISCFQEVFSKNLNLAVIASDGELVKLAKFKNIPYFLISEKGIPPRMSIGYQMIGLVKILIAFGILTNETLGFFKDLKIDSGKLEKIGKILAKKFVNKIPVIYSVADFKSLAYLWKTNFNENSKIHAFSNVFPEINHNEIESFLSKKWQRSVAPIFLESDSERIFKKSVEMGIKAIKKSKYFVEIIKLVGTNDVEKTIYGIILSYWISYYLAVLLKVDPVSNKNIIWIKSQIKNK